MSSFDTNSSISEGTASPAPPPFQQDQISEDGTTSSSSPTGTYVPSLRSLSEPRSDNSHPLGTINAARRPVPPPYSPSSPAVPTTASSNLTQDMQKMLRDFHQKRTNSNLGASTPTVATTAPSGGFIGGAFNPSSARSPRLTRPNAPNWQTTPAPVAKSSLAMKRGLKLPGGLPGGLPGATTTAATPLSAAGGAPTTGASESGSLFKKYENFVDTATGSLKFAGKAVIHGKGVEFSTGSSFSISLDELESLDELGKGNYGTVYKVIHRKPKIRAPGAGVAKLEPEEDDANADSGQPGTGIVMAMKEIRLELEDAKFAAIIMELDILHRCVSPYIIDFYGAFFQEGAVYICIEWMDGGSMDKLYGDGVPEDVLKKVTWATVMGLKYLKEEHNIIHRDVKPTNILVNTKGDVKLCDFGVSGNLVASIAKTNIGCQSYMAPERIASGGMASAGANKDGTYSVQSDIWSLGLSILECAMGRYPYPPETYNNIFSQLSAIVDGPPPDLPEIGYSAQARDFVKKTLHKIPKMRPTYGDLLRHPWFAEMQPDMTIKEEDEDAEDAVAEPMPTMPDLITKRFPEVKEWVTSQLQKREEKLNSGGKWGGEKPALHSVALDKVVSPTTETPSEPFIGDEAKVDGLSDGVNELTVSS